MAILKSNDDSTFGNRTGRTLAGGAVLGGIGYGAYRGREEFANLFKRTPNIVQQTTAVSQGLGNLTTVNEFISDVPASTGLPIRRWPMHHGTIMSAFERSGMQNTGYIQREIAESAFESLMSTPNITRNLAEASFHDILRAGTSSEAYDLARSSIQSAGGDADLFLRSMEEGIEGGVYPISRVNEMKSSSSSLNLFSRGNDSVDPASLKLGRQYHSELQKLAIDSGHEGIVGKASFVSIGEMMATGDMVNTPVMSTSVAGKQVVVPLQDTGYTFYGEGLGTSYRTRKAYDPATGKVSSYSKRYMDLLKGAIGQGQTQRDVNQGVHAFHVDMIEGIRDRDASARAAAVWTMPDRAMTSGSRVQARLAEFQAVSLSPGELEDPASVFKKGLFPFTSTQSQAVGTMSTRNLREDLYGPLGRWFPIGRNPLQQIRPGWGSTETAKRAAPSFGGSFGQSWGRVETKMKGAGFADLMYGGADPLSREAYSSPQLMSLYVMENEGGTYSGLKAKELGVISKEGAAMMEYERVRPVKVLLSEGHRMDAKMAMGFEQAAETGQYTSFETPLQGDLMYGTSAEKGKRLYLENSERMTSEVMGVKTAGGDIGTAYVKEKHRMTSGEYWKFFSPDVKHMATIGDVSAVPGAATAEGILGQNVEAAFSGALLEKNPYARTVQQVSAMSAIAGKKIDSGELVGEALATSRKMLNDPEKFLNVKEILNRGQGNAELALQKKMVSTARELGFSTKELGLTFGAMPENLASSVFSPAEMKEIFVPGRQVAGLSGLRLGDLAREGGAGGLGPIEETGFRVLSMQGEAGQALASELEGRLTGARELRSADRMMSSMLGQPDPTVSTLQGAKNAFSSMEDIASLDPKDFLKEEGRYVSLGRKYKELGGSSRLYIPGRKELTEELSVHAPRGIDGNKKIISDLERGYSGFIRAASKRGADPEILEASARELREAGQVAWAKQAAPRGKIMGSAYLTGISHNTDDTVKVSESVVRSRYDDLIGAAQSESQKTFLKQQKGMALGGHEMTGFIGRHPTIGQQSFQITKWKMDKTLTDHMVSIPEKRAMLQMAGQQAESVDVSKAVGMAGDFDKDAYIWGAIANKETEQKAARYVRAAQESEYAEYLFSHYALEKKMTKVPAKITSLSDMQNLVTGYIEATTAKTKTGQTNLALQKLKLAVSVAAPDKGNSLFPLFTHLEQAAISTKHGAATEGLYSKIQSAVSRQSAPELQSAIEMLMGDKAETITGTLGGQQMSYDYNPKRMAEESIDALKASSVDIENAFQRNRVSKKGQASKTLQQATELFNSRSASVDIAQALRGGETYGTGTFSDKVNRFLQRGAVKGNQFKSLLKKASLPLGVGAAIGAGVLLATAPTSGTLPQNREGANAGHHLNPGEDMMAIGPGMTPPPPRRMQSPKVYDIGSGKVSPYSSVSGTISDTGDSRWRDSVRQLGSSSGVNVNIRDNRQHLDPHSLAHKIHERL